MAERMPTDADIAAYVNAILGSRTAGTVPGRLNFLQDWSDMINFAPFGQQFVEEPFPEEQFAPVTREIYATDPNSPYLSIFDAIDQGIDPTSAARTAIAEGAFGDPREVRDDRLDEDILKTASDYSRELKTFQQERSKWEREQARKRAEAPVTLNELLFPETEYQVRSREAGMPDGYSVDDMLAAYNRSRMERGQAAAQRGAQQRAARRDAEPVESRRSGGGFWRGVRDFVGGVNDFAGNIVAPWRQQAIEGQRQQQGPARSGAGKSVATPPQRKMSEYRVGPKGSVADLIYRDAARRAMEQQKQTPVWSPKARQTMANIQLLSLLGGQ